MSKGGGKVGFKNVNAKTRLAFLSKNSKHIYFRKMSNFWVAFQEISILWFIFIKFGKQ